MGETPHQNRVSLSSPFISTSHHAANWPWFLQKSANQEGRTLLARGGGSSRGEHLWASPPNEQVSPQGGWTPAGCLGPHVASVPRGFLTFMAVALYEGICHEEIGSEGIQQVMASCENPLETESGTWGSHREKMPDKWYLITWNDSSRWIRPRTAVSYSPWQWESCVCCGSWNACFTQ
jgi:hypothetical protein